MPTAVYVCCALEGSDSLTPSGVTALSILLSRRHRELSYLQRVLTLLMAKERASSQLYMQFSKLGICHQPKNARRMMDTLSEHELRKIASRLPDGYLFRVVGDNCDYQVGVREMRVDHRTKDKHCFNIMAISDRMKHDTLDGSKPSGSPEDVKFAPSPEDLQDLRSDFAVLSGRVLCRHFPFLKRFAELADSSIKCRYQEELKQPSVVTSIGLLDKNEAKHGDMVDIMRFLQHQVRISQGACFDSDHPQDLVWERICSLLSNLSPLALTGKRNDHFAICRKSVWFTY